MKCVVLSVCLFAASLAGAAEPTPDIAITGLSVIDVETGEVREGQTLTIREGIIRSVLPGDSFSDTHDPDTTVYEFAGRFAIPGLWDMHVHLRGGAEMAEDNRIWMRQYLGNGVTSIRDAGGDIPDEVRAWKEAIANQDMAGPRIYSSLRKVDGSPVFRRGSVEITSPEIIPGALRNLNAAGADFVKVNDGLYPDSTYLDVLRQARKLGLRTAAHVPVGVSAEELAQAGLGSFEHAFFLTKFASADEDRLTDRFINDVPGDDPVADNFGMYNAFAVDTDDAKARRNFSLMADNAVAEAQRLLGLAAQQGVTILAGSDTGTTNTFMYPGDSLHHELVELVRGGLSPLQALQAATVNAASWFGLGNEAGSIEPGKWADVLILDGNPLDDIRNTRELAAVIQLGRLHDQRVLERLRKLPDGS